MVDYKRLEENLNEALNKETKESWDKFLDENKEELQKGFDMAVSWEIEAYSIDKKTGKIRCLSLEEALELKDNPNYEVVSIQDYSPEKVMKQFSEHLSSEELKSLMKPVLNIPSDATWDAEKWLEYSKTNKLIISSSAFSSPSDENK